MADNIVEQAGQLFININGLLIPFEGPAQDEGYETDPEQENDDDLLEPHIPGWNDGPDDSDEEEEEEEEEEHENEEPPQPEPEPENQPEPPHEQHDEHQLQENEKIVAEQEQQIQQMENQYNQNPEPTFLEKIQHYQKIYNHNMQVLNKQLNTFGSLYRQSKDYRFNF